MNSTGRDALTGVQDDLHRYRWYAKAGAHLEVNSAGPPISETILRLERTESELKAALKELGTK